MLSGVMRFLALAILLGMVTPQSGWAQTDDLDALDHQVVQLYRQGKYGDLLRLAEWSSSRTLTLRRCNR